jgi:hypothetical protein
MLTKCFYKTNLILCYKKWHWQNECTSLGTREKTNVHMNKWCQYTPINDVIKNINIIRGKSIHLVFLKKCDMQICCASWNEKFSDMKKKCVRQCSLQTCDCTSDPHNFKDFNFFSIVNKKPLNMYNNSILHLFLSHFLQDYKD